VIGTLLKILMCHFDADKLGVENGTRVGRREDSLPLRRGFDKGSISVPRGTFRAKQ